MNWIEKRIKPLNYARRDLQHIIFWNFSEVIEFSAFDLKLKLDQGFLAIGRREGTDEMNAQTNENRWARVYNWVYIGRLEI